MRVPRPDERQLFIGATGSGKTTLGAYVLSLRNIDQMPFVILNTKDDELLNNIPHVVELDGLTLPKAKHMQAGLFMVRPSHKDRDGMDALLHEIWGRTNCGVFVDEGLVFSQPTSDDLRTLLTQGRSRRCPVDICSQRPVWLDRYAFSESEHFYVMRLNSLRELDPIKQQTDYDLNMRALPDYHAYRVYQPTGELTIVPPSPTPDEIVDRFDAKLRRKQSSILI